VAEGRYKQNRASYLQMAENKAASARLMKAQGRTAKEIADELGVSRMTVSRYLKDVV
jgi:DNA-binding CsgD family transcriptional regulator